MDLIVSIRNELLKFNTCKAAVSVKPLYFEVKNTSIQLDMPTFNKPYVQKIVNAFTLIVIKKLNSDPDLQVDVLDDITKRFNNFLLVLKFVRDDDNACQQNLSNYYISQFKEILEQYNLDF
jgi:phosphoglucomutase